ncbi:MAG: hypothetical protein H8Z69_02035 [Nanohaloarchaea archaeon]|nr:hypothetical protein [Candidatus Nanohaloarchaea archaeon]
MSIRKRRDDKLKSHEETLDQVLDTYLPQVDHEYDSSDEFVRIPAKREAVEYITGIEFNPQDESVENYLSQVEGWMDSMIRRDNDVWEPGEPNVADGDDGYLEAEYFFDPRMDPGNMVDELEERPGPAT